MLHYFNASVFDVALFEFTSFNEALYYNLLVLILSYMMLFCFFDALFNVALSWQ